MDVLGHFLVALAIAVGLAGILLPFVPGLLLVVGAVLVWAAVEGTGTAWLVFGLAAVLAAGSQVVKFLVPGRRLRRAGVSTRTLGIGALAGVVGFFVVPVVGLVIGFVGGVYAAERARLGRHDAAWWATKHALRAVGLGLLIELGAGVLIALLWFVGAVFSG